MSTLLLLLLPITILNAWLRLVGFGSHTREGTIIAENPLPLLARIYMHAIPVAISILTAVGLALLDIVPWSLVLLPIVSGLILVAVPLRYTLTETGIQRTFGSFRRWTEFAGVERAPGGARLKSLPRTRPARIWLSGSRGDDEFLKLLRTLIRNAYQGRSNTMLPKQPDTPPARNESAMTSSTPRIATFKHPG